MKKHFFCLTGAIAGLLNGLFGAGGGVAVVPLLEHAGIDTKKSHATSIAIIAPLSLISSLLYFQIVLLFTSTVNIESPLVTV